MSDEVKAAAERWRVGEYRHDKTGQLRELLDIEILADAYVADQAQREREQAERALPIDEAWLMSIGFKRTTSPQLNHLWVQSEWHLVRVTINFGIWLENPKYDRGVRLRNMATTKRGMMLDLLSALQINTKGEV